MIKVSIVIPTHNRPADVIENVNALVAQIAGLPFEIIVVDSASSRQSIEELQGLTALDQVEVLYTDRAGSSAARNIGVEQSRGKWLAFLDDDVVIHKEWAANVLRRVEAGPINLGFIGGRVTARWPTSGFELDPDHLGHRAKILLSTLDDIQSFDATECPIGIGANMLVLRKAFDDVGGFPSEMGRVGKALGSGEDPHLMNAVVAAGFRAWYDGSIGVDHKISAERMQCAWLARRAKHEGGVSYRRMENAPEKILVLAKCLAALPILTYRGRNYEKSHEYLIRYHHNNGILLSSLGVRL